MDSNKMNGMKMLHFLYFALPCILSSGCQICEENVKQENTGSHKYLDSFHFQHFDEIIVIGDVHGCFDELILFLNESNTMGDNVLKIFTGDMINKGPKNEEVLELIKTSNSMISVRGNHEEHVLEEFNKSRNTAYEFLKSEEEWIRYLSPENVHFLSKLPHTISLLPLNVVIVHAGILPGTHPEYNDPHDLMNIRNIAYDEEHQCVYPTKEHTIGEPWSLFWKGPQHVIFGHDSRKMLQLRKHATGIDTGCVKGNFLTGYFISGPRAGSLHMTKALKKYTHQH